MQFSDLIVRRYSLRFLVGGKNQPPAEKTRFVQPGFKTEEDEEAFLVKVLYKFKKLKPV
jgi:hypothetical protein